MLFIMLYKVDLTFVDKILQFDHLNKIIVAESRVTIKFAYT